MLHLQQQKIVFKLLKDVCSGFTNTVFYYELTDLLLR